MNDVLRQSACELRKLLSSKEISAVELLRVHLEHIEQVNPTVNAIVTECFEQALENAASLDESGDLGKPLAGLPIAHKDLVSTKGILTTQGSPLYKDHIPAHNDYIIDRMQAAGAITIGKTNVPEFGAGSHTFNRVFGPSHNPYDLGRTCGGSSGGAAVSLATRMTALADGSDLGGSLRNPAAFCNVIGFRPTNNVLPPTLEGDHALNLASLGPMARWVADVELLFHVLAPNAPTLAEKHANLNSMDSLRIAFSENFGHLPVVPEIKQAVRDFATLLAANGATVVEATPDLSKSREIFHTVRGLSFRRRYDALSPAEKVELKPTILWNIAKGQSIDDAQMRHVQDMRKQLVAEVDSFFTANDYDLLVGPTTQVLPFPIPVEWPREVDGVPMDTYIDWMESCSLITTTECPALSLPCGFIDGLPVGMQLIARRHDDMFLLRAARLIEAVASSADVLPSFLCGD
ncbi:MAG: amidase [Gammaproteobacteria bacterium]|nr:amidase [Gammaproteobacteria bacterium]